MSFPRVLPRVGPSATASSAALSLLELLACNDDLKGVPYVFSGDASSLAIVLWRDRRDGFMGIRSGKPDRFIIASLQVPGKGFHSKDTEAVPDLECVSELLRYLRSHKAELQHVLGKYSQAAQFLNGVGLNPDTHADTGYVAFNDTPISTYFSKLPSSLLSPQPPSPLSPRANVNSSADDEPIIGLPGAEYADPQIMPLKDYIQSGQMDTGYYGPLQLGTPAQALTFAVDTGSADLWVPSACASCGPRQLDAYSSSSYEDTGRRVTVTYGRGRIAGTVAHDTLALGSLTIPQQGFVAAHTESHDFAALPSDGLLGLAFGSIASSQEPTPFENLLAAHKLPAAIFSVHLARGQEDGSAVCVGCYDLTRTTGPVRWAPLVSRTYWAVSMDGMASDPVNNLPTDLIAAIDTGSTLIYVPNDVAAQFYSMIPGAKDATVEYGSGFYLFPCATQLQVSLSLGGQAFALHPDDFNLGRLNAQSDVHRKCLLTRLGLFSASQCVGAVLGQSDPDFAPNLAVVGSVFLKSWYSTYDYAGSRVGLAPSVNNK
ncbi:hypothetical protein EIP86_005076 [Pleurotus ostreatoroseus]|nr:hypothetical protein EIP86_005076 [Pleurotus ostreatoroseus]